MQLHYNGWYNTGDAGFRYFKIQSPKTMLVPYKLPLIFMEIQQQALH